MKSKIIAFRLDKATAAKLEKAAAADNRSVSSFVTVAVKEKLARAKGE